MWICPDSRGHLQATGRDARGRKQYRYHPRWRAVRDAAKYGRMLDFGRALVRVRDRVTSDLSRRGLPPEKVLALVVHLLDTCFLRVGNEQYARDNDSYGLTTLLDDHARFRGARVFLEFKSKSGKERRVELHDRRLARIVKRCQDIEGQQLFQYQDADGKPRGISSGDVNDYLRVASGQDITAKDFRTWAATLCAAETLASWGPPRNKTHATSQVVRAVAIASEQLGNTPAVCRRSYIHPGVIEAYTDGALCRDWKRCLRGTRPAPAHGLRREERVLLRLLESLPIDTLFIDSLQQAARRVA